MRALGPGAVLGYCTNVHPAANAEEILAMIKTQCLSVKEKIDPGIEFGIGLWLSSAHLFEFQRPDLLERLKHECQHNGIGIFSWSAFPYLDFHQKAVKERVYLPHWADKARLSYTLDLMTLIARLQPDHPEMSISTLPVSGKVADLSVLDIQRAVDNLIEVVIRAVEIEEATGISIHLDLEPEPFCFLETSQDVVRFFKEYLLPRGVVQLVRQAGYTAGKAESVIRDKIRVCYDTCHAAVMFEAPASLLGNYERLGIRIGKVQISSGLVYRFEPEDLCSDSQSLSMLRELSLDRYLHQVVGRRSHGELVEFEFHRDLPEWIALHNCYETGPKGPGFPRLDEYSSEYRIHYHVPVFMERMNTLGTTQAHILELLSLGKTRAITQHWEVETYTWSGLPQAYRNGGLPALIAREINWVHQMSQERLLEI